MIDHRSCDVERDKPITQVTKHDAVRAGSRTDVQKTTGLSGELTEKRFALGDLPVGRCLRLSLLGVQAVENRKCGLDILFERHVRNEVREPNEGKLGWKEVKK